MKRTVISTVFLLVAQVAALVIMQPQGGPARNILGMTLLTLGYGFFYEGIRD